MGINTLLQQIGLTKHQVEIYLALLDVKYYSISDIAKNTQIHRPIIYKELPVLIKYGLVLEIEQGKRVVYSAESPLKLQEIVNQISGDIKNAVPELQKKYEQRGNHPIIKFYEGKEGVSFVFLDLVNSLKKGDVFYRYTSNIDSARVNKYLPKEYRKIRDKKQLERFVIGTKKHLSQKKKRLERAEKYMPEKYGKFDYQIVELIYGNKVAYIDYETESTMVIESKKISSFQRKIFKALYDKL